jgi:hypothetical protein
MDDTSQIFIWFILIAMMIIGIILFVYNRKIESELDNNVSQSVRNAHTGILVISVLLVSVPATIMMCLRTCPGKITFERILLYAIIFFTLGVTITVLGLILQTSKTSISSDNVIPIWGSGISIIILSLVFGFLAYKNKGDQVKGTEIGIQMKPFN